MEDSTTLGLRSLKAREANLSCRILAARDATPVGAPTSNADDNTDVNAPSPRAGPVDEIQLETT
tara:strand:- start:26 stop:217 length:192 start_codon:yes stop_codon:yes gene_type:complete